MKYDIIGDIHGYFPELVRLLKKMGYGLSERGHYYHPDRQAVFVGDYIDRGKNSREVVQLVKTMQEEGSAIALMGNHEYNAICFHTKGSKGEYLRSHTLQNINQHCSTLQSFGDHGFLKESLDWFKELPLYFENDYLRVVHACWEFDKIEIFEKEMRGSKLRMDLLEASTEEGHELYEAVETLLKGKELELPKGVSFLDKDLNQRNKIRVKWWENPKGKNYKEYAVKLETAYENLLDQIPENSSVNSIYNPKDTPVFFGHYWLDEQKPSIQKPNVCCVDYSVANDGKLVAYRFDGETKLNNSKFVF